MPIDEEEDLTTYKVVVNHEEQYSIWPVDRENPLGWRDSGPSGPKAECLAYIKEVWTDMRPLSLRKHMEEVARQQAENPPPPPPPPSTEPPKPDELVTRLATGTHPVEVGLRPEKTAQAFKDAIDRGYVHIKFTKTKGGTELGVRLDPKTSDWSQADFSQATGSVHVEGTLTLNYVKVRCLADINLSTLTGTGNLVILED
ncbi:MAG: MbtH family NRPS accessory protein [Nitrospira sp.]|nr:MbtH family NRPS accessory protein [Nitrospira sp.]HNP27634.1 MbtH family protein [Nitrospirales bacterium]